MGKGRRSRRSTSLRGGFLPRCQPCPVRPQLASDGFWPRSSPPLVNVRVTQRDGGGRVSAGKGGHRVPSEVSRIAGVDGEHRAACQLWGEARTGRDDDRARRTFAVEPERGGDSTRGVVVAGCAGRTGSQRCTSAAVLRHAQGAAAAPVGASLRLAQEDAPWREPQPESPGAWHKPFLSARCHQPAARAVPRARLGVAP